MLEDIIEDRKKKLQKLKEKDINPYPADSKRTFQIREVLVSFNGLLNKKEKIIISGRIIALRDQGKLIFLDIRDESGKIQGILKSDFLVNFSLLRETLDIGDFLEMEGVASVTQKGEQSIEATSSRIIAKSLRPLPDKWHGLVDIEERLRRRYVDLIMSEEERELFKKKSIFWQTTREFLSQENFLEVETPILQPIYGGADAEPFVTHHNALDTDFYLRIAPELYLKRLIVGGYEKVFEIGRVFRNEGIDREHLQDYTAMEFYWAYADYRMVMDLIERMYKFIIKETLGTLTHVWQGQEIDWGGKWKEIDYYEIFKKYTNLDLRGATEEDLRFYAKEQKIETEKHPGRGRLIDVIFKKMVRPHLIQPSFLVLPPVDIEPLAKRMFEDPNRVERFQVVACASELGKGFSELNDPVDQRSRFEEQEKMRKEGDTEAQRMDVDFVEALEYGMPPTGGWGHSERLFSVIMDKPLRETTFFPQMRSAITEKTGKSKETRIAVVVINKGAGLEPWQELNTVAHLNTEFGAHEGKKLLLQEEIQTKDKRKIKLNAQHAIIIKNASSSNDLLELSGKAKSLNLEVSEFIREMIGTTDDKKVISAIKEKNIGEVEYLGVLVFGNKKEVEKITDNFELYS